MKNVYEVLRQKELELTRLEKEVEALRVAAPLLSDEKEQLAEAPKPSLTATVPQPVRIPPVVAAQAAPIPARAAGWEDAAKRSLPTAPCATPRPKPSTIEDWNCRCNSPRSANAWAIIFAQLLVQLVKRQRQQGFLLHFMRLG